LGEFDLANDLDHEITQCVIRGEFGMGCVGGQRLLDDVLVEVAQQLGRECRAVVAGEGHGFE